MLGDIVLDKNWSEIKQICGSDSLCYVQQVADYCYNSATKIQELDADICAMSRINVWPVK